MSFVPNYLADAIRRKMQQQYGHAASHLQPLVADPYAALKTQALQAFMPKPMQAQQPPPQAAPPPAGDLFTQYSQKASQAGNTANEALQALSNFEQNTPQPQLTLPKEQTENPITALVTGLAALLSPQLAPGIGAGMAQRQQQFKDTYDQQAQEARDKYQAAADTRAQEETALEKRADAANKQEDTYDKLALQAQKEVLGHQVAQQRADAYAQNIILQHGDRVARTAETAQRDRDMAHYHAEQIGVSNKKLAEQYETTKWRVAAQLQTAGLRASTAIQIANQRQAMQLTLERYREMAMDRRAGNQNQIRVQIAAMSRGLNEYDSIIKAAAKPGAPDSVKQAAAQLLQPDSPYSKLLGQATTLGLTPPSFDDNQQLNQIESQSYEEFLSGQGDPNASSLYPVPGPSAAPTFVFKFGQGTDAAKSFTFNPQQPPQTPFTPPANLTQRYGAFVNEATQDTKVPQAWVYALMSQEDPSGDPAAKSSAGALGPLQLMPATAKALGVNPLDPRQNIVGGARYFAQQLNTFGGNPLAAAAAYNGGPEQGALVAGGQAPTKAETLNYVQQFAERIGMPLPWGATPIHYNGEPTATATTTHAKPVAAHNQTTQSIALSADDITALKQIYSHGGQGLQQGWNGVVTAIRQEFPHATDQQIEHYRQQITGEKVAQTHTPPSKPEPPGQIAPAGFNTMYRTEGPYAPPSSVQNASAKPTQATGPNIVDGVNIEPIEKRLAGHSEDEIYFALKRAGVSGSQAYLLAPQIAKMSKARTVARH